MIQILYLFLKNDRHQNTLVKRLADFHADFDQHDEGDIARMSDVDDVDVDLESIEYSCWID